MKIQIEEDFTKSKSGIAFPALMRHRKTGQVLLFFDNTKAFDSGAKAVVKATSPARDTETWLRCASGSTITFTQE